MVSLEHAAVEHADLRGLMSEELLFRGLLQTWAHRALPGDLGRGTILSWATLVTAALFSLFHSPFLRPNSVARGWFGVGSSLVTGIALGIVRDLTGRVYPAILLHSLGNPLDL